MRKSLNNHQFNRRKNRERKPKDRILIVCEAEKTEPSYFQEIKNKFRANNIKIVISKSAGLNHMIKTAKYDKDYSDYDFVYFVFDYDFRDEEFKKLCNEISKNKKCYAIKSYPCFEYWFLCHFNYSKKEFSNADECIKELKKYLPTYEKNQKDLYQKLFSKLETAKDNAKKSVKEGKPNPSTNIDELVEKLEEINTTD